MRIHSQTKFELDFANLMTELGCHCERIAGSGLRQESVCDCVLFKDGKTFLVEVKATKYTFFRINGRIKTQIERLVNIALKHQLTPLLAIRFKRRGWNIITLSENYPKKIVYDTNSSIEKNNQIGGKVTS